MLVFQHGIHMQLHRGKITEFCDFFVHLLDCGYIYLGGGGGGGGVEVGLYGDSRCHPLLVPYHLLLLEYWHIDGHHKLIRWKLVIHGGEERNLRLTENATYIVMNLYSILNF